MQEAKVRSPLSAMPWKNPDDLVLTDLIPSLTSRDVIDIHKAGMEISREREAFVEDKCHAVIAVTWRVEDLSIESKAG